MILVDVNVLVYALREDAPRHIEYRRWLQETVNGDAPFALSDVVLSGVLRIATHPQIFDPPTSPDEALDFIETLRSCSNCVFVTPGPRHWAIFSSLCRATGARGNLVPDAFLAALAIESESEWVTTDRHFRRFPGLRWRHPLVQ
jgi:toxin-antitoxin system PIN domain toxin